MKQETRAKLIRSARRAFAKNGFAQTSMDELTADAGLTRGALYHHFEDKKGLLAAVVNEIDDEMALKARQVGQAEADGWKALLAEGAAYIEMSMDPEIQRIVLLDGPAALGDPSKWPSQNRCLNATRDALKKLVEDGTLRDVDMDAAAWLLNGAALNAAIWLAGSESPKEDLVKVTQAFRLMAEGLLKNAQ